MPRKKSAASAICFYGVGRIGELAGERQVNMGLYIKKGCWYVDYYVQGRRKRERK